MLKLVDIKKDYSVGNSKVHALKGVSITFRNNEFVSILGPSGCGKTTMLNIIGGLDHYTSGDLFINGTSTKEFGDRDWDTYRNHKVGFVFQSYNLIPHQTVLENVELALTIAGIEKEERIKRAKEALDKVGLQGQYNKKPNQLSGGQCQRVAIARALVNEPEILLADEPTGALDTKTSVQIMELIKEISKERLVIMVTHNPELAEQYSSRIVKLLDGNIVSDSNAYSEEENKKEETQTKTKKSKLSLWSAFKLSARNLKSKLKRTLLVCLASSIGIIGVASVLAVSTGVQNYINAMQNDMLSGNPITISEQAIDISAMLGGTTNLTQMQAVTNSVEDGKINVQYLLNYFISKNGGITNFRVSNNITQEYVDYVNAMPTEIYSVIAQYYGIDITNNIYTNINLNTYGEQNLSLSAIRQMYTSMLEKTEYKDFASMIVSLVDSFEQAPDNAEFIASQYDIISNPQTSKIATESNEIMIVVNDDTQLTDMLLAQLGYYSQDQFINIIYKGAEDERYNPALEKNQFTIDEIVGKTFTWYPNNTVFNKTNSLSPLSQINPFTYNAYENSSWETGKELTITAVLRPKEDISYGCLESGFYYTKALTDEIIADSLQSEIVKYLNDNDKTAFTSASVNSVNTGITYNISFNYENIDYSETCFVGTASQFAVGNSKAYILTRSQLGGNILPNKIEIYPVDFTLKDKVTEYLSEWNSENDIVVNNVTLTKDQREKITYTDNLSIIISLVNNMINIVTYALVAFTALSLVVSTVMIAIITYVSVIERIKEIGVIRALGGRKKDVSRLFNAETFIIGFSAGAIGIAITYGLSALINLIVGNLSGIYTIASLPWQVALIMIAISVGLTCVSGLIPASLAAKKDPVEALRTE